MSKRIKAEIWDKFHHLCRFINDRVIHVELRYNYNIQEDILKSVLKDVYEQMPVLRSTFKDNRIYPYWAVNDFDINLALTVEYVDEKELENKIDKFMVSKFSPESKVQMRFALFKSDKISVICVISNHMCMDGGDFKYLINEVCGGYSRRVSDPDSKIIIRTGSRSHKMLYKDMSANDKKAAEKLYKNINIKDTRTFPFTSESREDTEFIAKKKLTGETFDKMKAAGKKYGATITEILLAAYFYSMYEIGNISTEESMSISSAVDLRRHMKNSEGTGLSNYTAWMQCKLDGRGSNIFETLEKVKKVSNEFKKDKFLGLHGVPLLSFGFHLFPYALAETIVKKGYDNPLIGISNIGIIDVTKTALDGNEPYDGYMTGAVKYKPYGFITVTTMRKELTLTMCEKGNKKDRELIDEFLNLIEKNVKAIAEG